MARPDRLRPVDAAVWILCALAAAFGAWRAWRTPVRRAWIPAAAAGLILPVIAAAGWLAFSGAVKAANPLSARLAWSTVAWQHYGPLSMPPRDVRFP